MTQKVDIYFSFIGNIEMAIPEKKLTPEEAEAQRISEEKREKQRKIYQRRKETGKAKIYYERSRAKQKAKMEAAKEALRKEDQKKGVYSLVKNLPKEEPRKAVV